MVDENTVDDENPVFDVWFEDGNTVDDESNDGEIVDEPAFEGYVEYPVVDTSNAGDDGNTVVSVDPLIKDGKTVEDESYDGYTVDNQSWEVDDCDDENPVCDVWYEDG